MTTCPFCGEDRGTGLYMCAHCLYWFKRDGHRLRGGAQHMSGSYLEDGNRAAIEEWQLAILSQDPADICEHCGETRGDHLFWAKALERRAQKPSATHRAPWRRG